jgi:NADP-dependent 3-hydroxy acid dehydrogenase YdfG
VTGGNKGIGFAAVKQLAQHGLTVVLTARKLASWLKPKFGGIDILVSFPILVHIIKIL